MFSLIPWKKRHNGNIKVRQEDRYPDYPLMRIRDEFDTLMQRFFGDNPLGQWPSLGLWEPTEWTWNTGMEDRGNEYVFQAEVPGFESEDFDVKLKGNTLVVRAESKEEKKGNEGSSYRYGRFFHTVTLPGEVHVDQVDARYHSGVLEVHLPKSASVPTRRIEVTTT